MSVSILIAFLLGWAASTTTAMLNVLRSCDPSELFASPILVVSGSVRGDVAIADFDNDGNLDLVATLVDESAGGLRGIGVSLGAGDGDFHPESVYLIPKIPTDIELADLNADGFVDVVVSVFRGGVYVFMNQSGMGFIADQPIVSSSWMNSVAAGDIDGDGDTDIVLTNMDQYTVEVFLGDGQGQFQFLHSFGTQSQPRSACLADLNGDGKLDFSALSTLQDRLAVYFNDGTGYFEGELLIPVGDVPAAHVVSDVDHDGHQDVVVCNQYGDSVSVILGGGDGSFTAASVYATGTQPVDILVADFNGDGPGDIVTANRGTNFQGARNISVLINNGYGIFSGNQNYSLNYRNYSVAAGDLDGNGTLDLVVGGSVTTTTANTVSVLFGQCAGQGCPADIAEPFGTLNFFDLAGYIGLFNAGDPTADLAAPFGSLNFFDVAAYIASYNAGCP